MFRKTDASFTNLLLSTITMTIARRKITQHIGAPPPIVRQLAAEQLEAAAAGWLSTVPPNACWPWAGVLSKSGYGRLTISGQHERFSIEGRYQFSVHRLAFELWKGLIPKGQVIMHQCDNRACFNPQHLFLGTQHENMHDKHAKKRGWRGLNERVELLERQFTEMWDWFNQSRKS